MRKKKVAAKPVFGVGSCFRTCQQKNKLVLGNFKGLSQNIGRGRVEFVRILHASPFIEDLSRDTVSVDSTFQYRCLDQDK